MSRRPLRWRVLDALDRARDAAVSLVAAAVTVVAIGWTMLPSRRRPGFEQQMDARRQGRDMSADSPKSERPEQ